MKKGQSPQIFNNINQQNKPSSAVVNTKKPSEYKNKYREIEQIGKGTSGTVFLVKQKLDKKFYIAKKIILTNLNEQERSAVEQELVLLRKLKHPHIVGYKESFIETYYMIIIMEYCEQGDLSFHIKQKQKEKDYFPEKVILNWFIQLTMALDFIHEQHVLHRDVKCSNIFLTANGSIKLGDFGISKVLNSTTDKAQTLIGTPYYLSPEVCENKPYTYQSDIWALGCVLFEMCALKHPFMSESIMSLVVKIMRDPNPNIPNIYSNDLNCLVQILLAKKPESRPRTKQIISFPFVVEIMKDFVSSKGLKGELKNLPIKKTQLHIKKEKDRLEQQPLRRNSGAQQAHKQQTPISSNQKGLAHQNNIIQTPKVSDQSKQPVGSAKVQRKNSNDIKKMEELIQKQMKDVKNDVQKRLNEVQIKKVSPQIKQEQHSVQSLNSKPSTSSSNRSSQQNPLNNCDKQSQKQSPVSQVSSKQGTPSTSNQKKQLTHIQQDASSQKPTTSSKNSSKALNQNEEQDRKIQEMMKNIQNQVRQEYEQIKKESPKKSPVVNNQKQVNNGSHSQQQNQKQNLIQPQTNTKQQIHKNQQYEPTPTQSKQSVNSKENSQRYNSNYSKDNFEMTQIEEAINIKNMNYEKAQTTSLQSEINDNSQKINIQFNSKIGYNSLLQDSNVSLNLSLTNDSVFNNTNFKSNLTKKQNSVNSNGGKDQPIIEEINEHEDQNEHVSQQRSQTPSDISEYKNEFLNSEFIRSDKSNLSKYQTVISEHIQTQMMTAIPEMMGLSKQKSNDEQDNHIDDDFQNDIDFAELPQREDYIDSDEDNEYEEDFEISSEEEGDSLSSHKEKNDFRLTRKNIDKELDEVLEVYKSQLMNNSGPEEYNKFKHMLNMSEIQEASDEYSTGEISRKKYLEQGKQNIQKK